MSEKGIGNEAIEKISLSLKKILSDLSADHSKHKCHVVERVESMPEGRDHEHYHVLSKSRPPTLRDNSSTNVVLEPKVHLVVPKSEHFVR